MHIPDLSVPEGAVVQINLINADGAIHDIAVPEFGAGSGHITAKGAATAMVFLATRAGSFEYLCTLPGHKAAGMFGQLIVDNPREKVKSTPIDVA
jgi:nitrite reductase (NO-forming)